MLEHAFVDPTQVITMALDGSHHGKRVGIATTSVFGRFRENLQVSDTGGLMDASSFPMVHYPASTAINEGDVVVFDEKYYRVTLVVRAKRMGETDPLFIKCELEATAEPEMSVSVS